MRIILLICLSILFFTCSVKEIPDNSLAGAYLSGKIIKENTNGISSKDDLVTFAIISENTGKLEVYLSSDYYMNDTLDIYLKPFYENKDVLNEKDFPKGMPVKLHRACDEDGCFFISNKIILTNGLLSLADSSYNEYTILPVMPFQDIEEPDISNCDYTITIRNEVN